MELNTMAKMAYGAPAAPTRTPRGIEYDIFARVTKALIAATLPEARSFPALAAAVHDNLRLWTVLQADLSDPANALPPPLRARLFYLAEFTRQHSRKVLSDTAGAAVLIDINMAVMRGLRGEGSAA